MVTVDIVSADQRPLALHPDNGPYVAWDDEAETTAGVGHNFREAYVMFRRNIWLVAGVMTAVIVLALIITLLMTPMYDATSTVQIDQEADRVLTTADVRPSSSGPGDADRFLQTQVDILRSRSMVQRVAQALGLFGNAEFYQKMRVKAPANVSDHNDPGSRARVMGILANTLSIDLPRQSRVLKITIKTPDPAFSAQVADAYSNEFIRNNLQRKYDSSSYARDFLSKQLAEAKSRLETSERDLNSYARSASLIKTAEPTSSGQSSSNSITTASLVQLNTSANDARAARIAAEEKWRNVASTPLMSIPDVLSNGAIQVLIQKQGELQNQLNQELARHRDGYPTVVQLRAQVAESDRQVKALATNIRNSIRGQYEVALHQENSLNGQVRSLKVNTLAEQDRSVRYNILQRETDTNRTLYDGLLQRYKEVSAAAGITTNNISIVDRADVPTIPTSPRLMLNILLALLIGAALAAGAVFLKEQLDDSVRYPEDIPSKLGLNLLGAIPLSVTGETVLEALESPRSAVSEAYHALRTSVLYSSVENLPRTLLVTSGQAGEGKSTTSFALAADLARLDKRVLLIDVDLRRPSLHRVVGASNDVGISSVLTGQAKLETVIQGTTVPNLSFVSSGPVPPSPTELLGSTNMTTLLAHLSQSYEVIVLDGPPVLGLADAPILAAIASTTVFIVEAGRSRSNVSKGAIRRLRTARTRILGGVLTKFDARAPGSNYYDNNYYYYGLDNDKNDVRRIA